MNRQLENSISENRSILITRLMSHVEKSAQGYRTRCWLWTGARSSNGYGNTWVPRSVSRRHFGEISAHRLSYMIFVGRIPDGLQMDHLCRVHYCVNPKHLEAVTPRENARRSPTSNEMKTHCVHGHLLSGNNLIPTELGHRRCRACNRIRCVAYRIKKEKEKGQ